MRVLVTGGAGFIGSHICEHYENNDACTEIVVLDNFHSGFRENLQPFKKVRLIEGSITSKEDVKKAVQGVDYIFHEASLISVAESMEAGKTQEYVEVCVNGTLNVLDAASDAGVKRLVLASSAAIYGNDPRIPKVEWMQQDMKSPYAMCKYDCEFYCNLYSSTGRLSTVILRYFNVFGPRQNPKSQYAAAVPIFIEKALNNESIHVYGDGEQTRDFVYVKDIARANAFAAESHTMESGHVYNVGYGRGTSINMLAETIIEATNSESEIIYCDERPGDVKHSLASVQKLLGSGFQPEYTMKDALHATVEFYRNTKK